MSSSADNDLDPNISFNLSGARVLLVDPNPLAARVMAAILLGLGVRRLQERHTLADAQAILKRMPFDIMMISCELPEDGAYELVRWLRRSKLDDNALTPIVMISGYAKAEKIARARDCGANFIIAQPFSPASLLKRILWIARDSRSFLETGDYFGPDRRVRDLGPVAGVERRSPAVVPSEKKKRG